MLLKIIKFGKTVFPIMSDYRYKTGFCIMTVK